MATLVNVCQRMISMWSIWYTDRYSLSTLSPLKRVYFIIWKHLMRKEYMVILMYHYSHRFVQHASADIFLQRYLRHCKRQTQGWKSSSNGVCAYFQLSLKFALLNACASENCKKISFGQAEKLADRREKIRAYGTDGRKHQKAVGKTTDMVLQVFSQTYSECGREGNRRQTVGLWLQGWKVSWRGCTDDGSKNDWRARQQMLTVGIHSGSGIIGNKEWNPIYGLLQKGMWTHRSNKRIWPCKGMRRKTCYSWKP